MRMKKLGSLLLAALLSVLAVSGAAEAAAGNVPFAAYGRGVDSGMGDGRSYYYIVLAEQVREVREVEVTLTHEGVHRVWAVGKDGKTIKVGGGTLGKGTHRIQVTADMARLEFNLFTDEIPFLGLKVPGGIPAPDTPYAGRRLVVLGDSLSAAYDWKIEGDDPNARGMASQWWFAAAREFGMTLLKNDSVSSSGVFKETEKGLGDSGLQRCASLHTAAQEPDDIFVLLGVNDLLNGCTVEKLAEGYRSMLQETQKRYPQARIVLFSYPRFGTAKEYDRYVEKVDRLNAVIRAAAAECGVDFVDLSGTPFTAKNIGRYTRGPEDFHLNRRGQELVGQQAVQGLYALAAAKAAPAS